MTETDEEGFEDLCVLFFMPNAFIYGKLDMISCLASNTIIRG